MRLMMLYYCLSERPGGISMYCAGCEAVRAREGRMRPYYIFNMVACFNISSVALLRFEKFLALWMAIEA